MISFNFENQIAIVTGGSRGIGAATVKELLEAKASVVAIYSSNDQAAEEFKQSLGTLAEKLTLKKLNVASYNDAEEFFKEFDRQFDRLDILVNSAGIRQDAILPMMTEDAWNNVLQVNLYGAFNMTKLAVQRMLPNRYGRIVNVTSPSGRIGLEGQANYAASKAGLVAMTKSLAKEVAKRNITANCISPGFIDTDFIAKLPPEQLDQYKKSVPLKRFGKPQEVAEAILFLASKQAAYITGTVLEISGGLA